MYLGRIVEVGTTEHILASPQHPYTRALLSVVPEHDRVEQQILTGEAPDPTSIPQGCRFHPRCPLYQSGEAERLGILDACATLDPVLTNGVACHAINSLDGRET
jgi:oligopeptide/dipeptide ABC transporter ATP-binding protein